MITSNGTIEGTIDSVSCKYNKIYPKILENKQVISSLNKQNQRKYCLNKEFLHLLKYINTGWDSIKPLELGYQLLPFSQHEVFIDYSNFLEILSIEYSYFPWYTDTRYRLYCYSSLGPTSSRLFRFIYYYDSKESEDYKSMSKDGLIFSENKDYFSSLEPLFQINNSLLKDFYKKTNTSLPKFLPNFLLKILSKNKNFYEVSPKNNLKTLLFLLIIGYRLVGLPTKKDNFPLFLEDLYKSNFLEIGDELFNNETGNTYQTSLFFKQITFFSKVLKKENFDKDSAIELYYLLYLFPKITYHSRMDFPIIVDVSSSALVLNGLILGYNHPEHLNVNNNYFLPNDPYSMWMEIFFKNWEKVDGFSIPTKLKDRKIFKKPVMTTLYGSKQLFTVNRLIPLIESRGVDRDLSNLLAYLIYVSISPIQISPNTIQLIQNYWVKVFKTQIKAELIQTTATNSNIFSFFFKKPYNFFEELAKPNLLYHMGIVFINKNPVSLIYHDKFSRISAGLKKSKEVRVYSDNQEFYNLYWYYSLTVNWPPYLNESDVIFLVKKIVLFLKKNKNLSSFDIKKTRNLVQEFFETEKKFEIIFQTKKKLVNFLELPILCQEKIIFISLYLYPHLNKFSNAFRANTIHTVDASIVHELIISSSYPITTIHDAFIVNVSDFDNFIQLYAKVFNSIELEINNNLFTFAEVIKNNLHFK